VAVTVNELEAVLPVKLTPPEFAVTAPVVLFLVPAVVAVTFTDRLHDPFTGIVPPLKLTVVAPAAAANVPPHVFVSEGVDATWTPAGRGSLKAALANAVAFVLLRLKLSVDVPLTVMLAGLKDLLILGGARMDTL